MGGGGTLEKLFPGYKNRLWQQVPAGVRRKLIERFHLQYERQLRETCLARPKGLLRYNSRLTALAPSEDAKVPFVDYKRQQARGTFLTGTDAYLGPHNHIAGLSNLYNPGKMPPTSVMNKNTAIPAAALSRNHCNSITAESMQVAAFESESAEQNTESGATSHQNYNLKVAIAALLAGIFLFDYGQSRPVAWCIIFDSCPPRQPWYYRFQWHSHDVKAVRRGFEVFRQVCSACHSLKRCRWWYLMKDVYPVRRVQEFAAEKTTIDGLTSDGELNIRPCMPWDYFPRPYPTKEAAEEANNGKEPPDFSEGPYFYRGGADYMFAVLTGCLPTFGDHRNGYLSNHSLHYIYRDPPAGLKLTDGTFYNPWFAGSVISMPPPLEDGLVEYEDGTPATVSQMAKDVVNFLTFINDPLLNERKLYALKAIYCFVLVMPVFWALRRMAVMGAWNRRVDFDKLKWI